MSRAAPVGVVLTGGGSRRMGRDKALLPVDGVPMARRVADALAAAGCVPVFAVGGDVGGLAAIGLDAVPDAMPGSGPLGGLVTAVDELLARGWQDRDLVAVACDLPGLDGVTIRRLLDVGDGAANGADVICARTDRIEPLCARWLPGSFATLRTTFASGERAVRAALDGLRVATVDVDRRSVRNVNSPSDVPGGSLPA